MQDKRSVPISALQHYVFCPRQCALIHTERVWAENSLTFLGKLDHTRVESACSTTKGRLREVRSVQLLSEHLGVHGVSDVVEYEQLGDTIRITPIEYKHGIPKIHRADEVQLCAQALCLEEMHNCHIGYGYLFYHTHRKRLKIEFTEELRQYTKSIIVATYEMFESGVLPVAVKRDDCAACSLYDLCLPPPSSTPASFYNERMFNNLIADETTS